MKNSLKLIAYYLPQYYEIEFNNKYWGKGHTEWTHTANAKPLFKGHYQPHVPADLGFYNLLMPEVREAQAQMAKKYGIDGFCYWHYWFGNGKTIMEKPFQAVLESGKPDFPFCLCWANHSWHNPRTKELLQLQEYFGESDHKKHFFSLLPAFKDNRYIKINNKPIFVLFQAESIPSVNKFIYLWNKLAQDEGFNGIHFVGMSQNQKEFEAISSINLDTINTVRLTDFHKYRPFWKDKIKYFFSDINNFKYKEASKYFISPQDKNENIIPTIIPGWDHSPRNGKKSLILTDYTPKTFENHLHDVFRIISQKENKFCFIKAWNEWGEGNHLEPDLKYGLAFLETLKRVKEQYQ